MNDVTRRVSRWAVLATLAAATCAPAAQAAPSAHVKQAPPGAQGHGYRHGVVPQRGHQSAAATTTTTSANDLNYGGGISGVGVTTGKPKVYLVFWGSQWGAQGTNAQGNVTLAGDPRGMAPYVESFIKGIGTNNEQWSGVMTQYCQGVASGSQSCPSSSAHVGYPTGGAFAGVWVDESTTAPSQATGNQIGSEAVRAATHFGNTTQSANLPAQYVIVSPAGTHPDGFNTATGNFCAWHDYTGDSTLSGGAVSSPDGLLAFTNLPYITDAGSSCGQNFVNGGSAGTLDGVSIVEGHEYAETVTDQYPAGGWTDTAGNENGDKCAWVSTGSGASQNVTFATGTFAMQTTWSNDASGCQIAHAIVGAGPAANTVSVTNPGNQSSPTGAAITPLQIKASDSAAGASLTYGATALPPGLSLNTATGVISGTPSTAGSYAPTVTATDSTGASGSASFTWTVTSPGGCAARQLLGNPGFETGTASPWSATAGVISASSSSEPARSGSYLAWLDGYGTTHADTLAQSVSVPKGCSAYAFSFWLHIDTAETTTTVAYDTLKVQVLNSAGTVLGTLATFSNLNAAGGYVQHSYNLSAYAGQTVTLKFTGTEDASLATSFVIDDTALNVS